ncbi:MAG TPA: hypothetical protein VN457_05060, partial [Chlamydiales bacterium]|nr:hypothetical protein [Chlamydiales bacterium]
LMYLQNYYPLLYTDILNDLTTKTAVDKLIKKHINKLFLLEKLFLQKPLSEEQYKEYLEKRRELDQLIKVMSEIDSSFDLSHLIEIKKLLPSDAVSIIQQVHCGLDLSDDRVQQLLASGDMSVEQLVIYYLKEGGLVQKVKMSTNGSSDLITITRFTIEPLLKKLREGGSLYCVSRDLVNRLHPSWHISPWEKPTRR